MMTILYDLIFMIPICMIATAIAREPFGAPENAIPAYLVALTGLGICMLLKHWKNRLKFLAPGVLLVLGGGIILIQSPESRGEFLFRNQWILWLFLIAVTCFFAGWLFAESRIARRVLAGGTFGGLMFVMGFWYGADKIGVALALFLIVAVLADEVQWRWEKSGYVDGKGHLVSIAPFLLLLCFFVYLLPAPEDPYDWNFAVKIWERATSVVKITGSWFRGGSEDYGGVVGFGGKDSFWGSLSKKERTNMYLSGNKESGQVIYLTGRTLDHFDGKEWSATYVEENRDRMMDTLETICAVKKYDPDYMRNYIWRTSIQLRYEEFNTRYLFTPLKPVLGTEHVGKFEFDQNGGDLVAKSSLGYGTEYTIPFYKLNQGHVAFREFIENAEGPDPESWESVRQQFEPIDPLWDKNSGQERYAGTSYEDYQAYVERIHEVYLPETPLSEELKPYVDTWLEGAQTDYEKLSCIESVLAQMEYSLTPGNLPEDIETPQDFLDYFMLESQVGYCSHYATAFILLARSQGIPARYAQGFYVVKGDEEIVEVKSSMAHSWPEAYLEGIGWIPFEPTPGKKYVTSWAILKKASDSGMAVAPEMEKEEEEELPPKIEKEEESLSIQWHVILIPVGLVIAFLIIYLMIDRLVAKARYRKLDEHGKFRVVCRKNLKVLSLLGLDVAQGETIEEFTRRAAKEVSQENLGFLLDCELAAYAGKQPTKETRENAEKDLKELMKILKEAKGKWFFWYRFLIGRMEGEKNRS